MFLVLGIGCFGCEFVPCCALKNGNLRGNPNKRKKRKTKIGLVSLPPSTPIFRKHPRPHGLSRRTNTHNSRKLPQPPPHPQLILRSVTSGTSRDLREKRRRSKIGFYFFTYEWSRRRLSLIKMINGVEEALILLFTAFKYEYLF